jgi:pyridoxine/pyridoxamine 5'-phosphate oxidase
MLIDPNLTLTEILSLVLLELKKGPTVRKHPFRYTVLSTSVNNQVNSRWVVFRKFADHDQLHIYTDSRSKKVTELERNGNASLLFYHPRQKLQIRLNGNIELHHQDSLTEKYWPGVKSTGAKDYTSLRAPGETIESAEEAHVWEDDPKEVHFMILEFQPRTMDVLQLGKQGHLRFYYEKKATEWKGQIIVP